MSHYSLRPTSSFHCSAAFLGWLHFTTLVLVSGRRPTCFVFGLHWVHSISPAKLVSSTILTWSVAHTLAVSYYSVLFSFLFCTNLTHNSFQFPPRFGFIELRRRGTMFLTQFSDEVRVPRRRSDISEGFTDRGSCRYLCLHNAKYLHKQVQRHIWFTQGNSRKTIFQDRHFFF